MNAPPPGAWPRSEHESPAAWWDRHRKEDALARANALPTLGDPRAAAIAANDRWAALVDLGLIGTRTEMDADVRARVLANERAVLGRR